MPYATVIHVLARNSARATYTATTVPNASQVIQHLVESGAQLDQWLLAGGYDAPFDAAIASGNIATAGQVLLQRWNSIGAALAIEESAVQSDRIKPFQDMWQEAKQIILDKTVDVPLPMLRSKSMPRGPGVPGSLATTVQQEFTFDNTPAKPFQTGGAAWDL